MAAMPIAFSSEWVQAWAEALNASPEYRAAASSWEGTVAATVTDPPALEPEGAVFLDLHRGECRAARVASPGDLADATFVLDGPPSAWRELLAGQASALTALMSGRIRLRRGQLAALLPHAGSARELVRLATRVSTEFPAHW